MGLAAGLGTLLGAAPLAALGGFRLLAAAGATVAGITALRLLLRVSLRRPSPQPVPVTAPVATVR